MFRMHDGNPGGGKSSSVYEDVIYHELVHGKRHIATNLAIDVDALAEYIYKEHSEYFGIYQRLRILTPSECLDFYNHPRKGLDITERIDVATGSVWSAKKQCTVEVKENRPDFSMRGMYLDEKTKNPDYVGTVFVIDEAQEFFNSRNWQTTSEDTLYYNTQHRKCMDDVHIITPNISYIDKQFRDVAQDFTRYRNLSYEWAGFFALPKRILWSVYLSPPTSAQGKAMKTGWRKLNIELANTFDTAAGVGVKGAGADKGLKPKRGIPLWVMVVGLVAILGGLFLALHLIMASAKKKVPLVAQAAMGTNKPRPVQSMVSSNATEQVEAVDKKRKMEIESESEPDYYCGYQLVRGRLTVFLESGEKVSSDTGRVTEANSRYAVIDGKRIHKRKIESKENANHPNNNHANRPYNNHANQQLF